MSSRQRSLPPVVAPTDAGTPAPATDDDAAEPGDSELAEYLGMRPRRTPPALVAGHMLGDTYRIDRRLGAGGMGVVYLARDVSLRRDVAIKLHAAVAGEPGGERLVREATALAQLVHPNVVTVYRVDTWCDHPYVAMEYVDGKTARGWAAEARRSWIEIVRLYVAAARGLAAAHHAGLVHRDFKPDNVLVGKDGRIRVADFGLARAFDEVDRGEAGDRVRVLDDVTMTGAVMGTPAYMAPEQRRSGKVGPVADQFSFAVALWEALTGARPYAGDTEPALEAAIDARRIQNAPPHLPRRLVRALHRALSVDPAARFGSMDELIAELEAILPAPRASVWPFVLGAVATAGIGAVAAWVWWPTAASPPRSGDPPATAPPSPPGLVDLDAATPLTRHVWKACAYAPAFLDPDTLSFDLTVGDAVDLYTMPAIGGEPVQRTSEPPWEWRSHPGARPGEVVYLVHDQEVASRSRVDVIDVMSGRRRTVQTGPIIDAVYAGDDLLYVSAEAGALHRIKGGHDEVVISGSAELGFADMTASVQGDRVAFNNPSRGPAPCWFPLDDPEPRCLDGQTLVGRPAFSADGDAIYYAAADGIRRAELATGESRIVVPGVVGSGVTVAPDGSALAYSDCAQRSDLRDVTADPPAAMIDDRAVADPVLGPGGALAWVRSRGMATVLVYRDAGGVERQLTDPSLGQVVYPRFDRSGANLVFQVRGGASPGIYVVGVPPEASEPHQVSPDLPDQLITWSADGRIVYSQMDDAKQPRLVALDADGGTRETLTSRPRRVLDLHRGTGELLVSARSKLYWYDPVTGRERPGPAGPPESPTFVSLSPAGRWLVYQTGAHGQIVWRLRLDPPGELEQVFELGSGETAPRAQITDDGHVVVAVSTWGGDLYRVPARPGSRL